MVFSAHLLLCLGIAGEGAPGATVGSVGLLSSTGGGSGKAVADGWRPASGASCDEEGSTRVGAARRSEDSGPLPATGDTSGTGGVRVSRVGEEMVGSAKTAKPGGCSLLACSKALAKAHDMRVDQINDSARLGAELLPLVGARQVRVQDLDRREAFQVQMLAQIDLGKRALAQQASQPVTAKLLPHAISHTRLPSQHVCS